MPFSPLYPGLDLAAPAKTRVVDRFAEKDLGLSGPAVVDGIAAAVGEIIAAYQQTVVTQNGLYEAAAGAWILLEIQPALGDFLSVQRGVVNQDRIARVTAKGPDRAEIVTQIQKETFPISV